MRDHVITIDGQEYVDVRTAVEMSGGTITSNWLTVQLRREGVPIRTYRLNENGVWYAHKEDLAIYLKDHPRTKWRTRNFDSHAWKMKPSDDVEDYWMPLYGFDHALMISKKSMRLYDATARKELKWYYDKKDHYFFNQYGVSIDGVNYKLMRHDAMAEAFVPNSKGRPFIHHIVPVTEGHTDDSPEKLLPVFQNEHMTLHELLEKGNMEEYYKMIEVIREDNKKPSYEFEVPEGKIYRVLADYEYFRRCNAIEMAKKCLQTDSDMAFCWYYLDAEQFDLYKEGKGFVPFLESCETIADAKFDCETIYEEPK